MGFLVADFEESCFFSCGVVDVPDFNAGAFSLLGGAAATVGGFSISFISEVGVLSVFTGILCLKSASSSGKMCFSSVDKRRTTFILRRSREPGGMLCLTTRPMPVAFTVSPIRSSR